ncbi:UpxY family transcription antiterminator [Bacteroides acidifaciens]|uniref:UpxY family transcription antiterminator n=1 Tax=Bacteroides acidifaciens TaxID=85831 RepID=UPI0025961D7D|nr:UpxY family transcription antiterminator [Bacteroides acidifaciens]
MEAQSKNEPLQTPPVDGTDDREARSKFWIAVCTHSRSEKKIGITLSKLGIENYIPVQSVIKQWSDRKKKMDIVVIPNIVFVHLRDNDISIIRQYSLIKKIISLPGQKEPARIPSEQIDKLKFMLEESTSPVRFRTVNFKKHDTVKVIRGNLKGLTGTVERISEKKSLLIVSIDLLGGATVEIDTAYLEILNDPS